MAHNYYTRLKIVFIRVRAPRALSGYTQWIHGDTFARGMQLNPIGLP